MTASDDARWREKQIDKRAELKIIVLKATTETSNRLDSASEERDAMQALSDSPAKFLPEPSARNDETRSSTLRISPLRSKPIQLGIERVL